ncbi:glycosyltransferase [Vibrio amylolyticus]|uniref:glycosyltransferase n=1 Tax=Vibrio amylolyticus TaxID=2847292 RepID=UPI00354C111F
MKQKNVLVIASAGGHLTQAMCATSTCESIYLVSNKINISNGRIKKSFKIWDTQYNPFIHIFNIFYAVYVLLVTRPRSILSTGGPIALPFALIAKFLPVNFIYLDTLSRVTELSNTGKLIKKHSLYDKFFTQWKVMSEKHNVDYIGKCFDILGENGYDVIRKPTNEVPVILVTVGTNQYDFDRLFEILAQFPLYNDDRVKWVIQKAHNKISKTPPNSTIVDMISRDQMEAYTKEASLVISHCGIGSINLMLSYQKQVIFVPRVQEYNEFSDDHQLQIANEIQSDRFTVLYPNKPFPIITFDQLAKFPLIESPVDTTNYRLANIIKSYLES